MSKLVSLSKKTSFQQNDIKKKLVSISEFLLTMPSKDRNDFMNKFVAPSVGEAIGRHYKMLVEAESSDVEAMLLRRRAEDLSEQAKIAIPKIMENIGKAMKDVDEIFGEFSFDEKSPTNTTWQAVRELAVNTIVRVSLSSFDGIGEATKEALDYIQKRLEEIKQNKNVSKLDLEE